MIIFSHTWNISKVNWTTIPIGNIVIDFSSKKIWTKTLLNQIVRTNTGANFLTDFSVFSYSSLTEGSFLRFKTNGTKLILTTVVPTFKLNDITGIFTTPSGFLGVNTSGQIVSLPKYPFNLNELTPVVTDSALMGDVLTFIYHPFPSSRSWQPRPEASRLSAFDDVSGINSLHNILAFCNIPFIGWNGAIKRELDISWDSSPNLGGNLNGNNRNIVNLKYEIYSKTFTGLAVSDTIDLDKYSVTMFECSGVKYLELQFSSSYLYSNGGIKFHSLELRNFTGVLQFKPTDSVRLENGSISTLDKTGAIIFNILAYLSESKIFIVVGKKTHTAETFDNG